MLLLPVLGYTKRDARILAEIEVKTERSGSAIRRTDSMIASVAIKHRALLYAFDLKHFKSLEDLGLKLFLLVRRNEGLRTLQRDSRLLCYEALDHMKPMVLR